MYGYEWICRDVNVYVETYGYGCIGGDVDVCVWIGMYVYGHGCVYI